MKVKRKQRKRSTHLELLGGVSSEALRALREIATQADLPLERVFRDVVAIGVSVVSDPDESPYQSLIAFRSGLAAKQAELENARTKSDLESQTPADAGIASPQSGATALELDSPGDFTPQEEPITDGLSDALERSGQRPALEEDSGSFASTGAESVS